MTHKLDIPRCWINAVIEAHFGWAIYNPKNGKILEVENIFIAMLEREKGCVILGKI